MIETIRYNGDDMMEMTQEKPRFQGEGSQTDTCSLLIGMGALHGILDTYMYMHRS